MFNPRMLVMARESRGLTQGELAKISATGQALVSKAEHGQVNPSDSAKAAWAKALQVPVSLFETCADEHLPVLLFRKPESARLNSKSVKTVLARVRLAKFRISSIAEAVEIPEWRMRSLSDEQCSNPERIAGELRTAWKIQDGPIDDVTTLIEDHGIVVMIMDFGTSRIDGMSVTSPIPIIFLNKDSSMDRRRFTMAHELGHILLGHHSEIPPEECEDDANRFASEWLMPSAIIRREFPPKVTLEALAHLKTRWGVSMQSLVRKARSLNRMSETSATIFWKKMSALGYRTNEPVTIPDESPTLVEQMIRVHLDELGYSIAELCSAISVEEEEFSASFSASETKKKGLRLVT